MVYDHRCYVVAYPWITVYVIILSMGTRTSFTFDVIHPHWHATGSCNLSDDQQMWCWPSLSWIFRKSSSEAIEPSFLVTMKEFCTNATSLTNAIEEHTIFKMFQCKTPGMSFLCWHPSVVLNKLLEYSYPYFHYCSAIFEIWNPVINSNMVSQRYMRMLHN